MNHDTDFEYLPTYSDFLFFSSDLASELDSAETQAAERELALSSTVTVFNSKIDCYEKILEESQIMKMKSDADCSSHLANFQGTPRFHTSRNFSNCMLLDFVTFSRSSSLHSNG